MQAAEQWLSLLLGTSALEETTETTGQALPARREKYWTPAGQVIPCILSAEIIYKYQFAALCRGSWAWLLSRKIHKINRLSRPVEKLERSAMSEWWDLCSGLWQGDSSETGWVAGPPSQVVASEGSVGWVLWPGSVGCLPGAGNKEWVGSYLYCLWMEGLKEHCSGLWGLCCRAQAQACSGTPSHPCIPDLLAGNMSRYWSQALRWWISGYFPTWYLALEWGRHPKWNYLGHKVLPLLLTTVTYTPVLGWAQLSDNSKEWVQTCIFLKIDLCSSCTPTQKQNASGDKLNFSFMSDRCFCGPCYLSVSASPKSVIYFTALY